MLIREKRILFLSDLFPSLFITCSKDTYILSDCGLVVVTVFTVFINMVTSKSEAVLRTISMSPNKVVRG